MLNTVTLNNGQMMKLAQVREFQFQGKRVTSVALPALWIRNNLKEGDKLGIFIDAETQALVIKKVEGTAN